MMSTTLDRPQRRLPRKVPFGETDKREAEHLGEGVAGAKSLRGAREQPAGPCRGTE